MRLLFLAALIMAFAQPFFIHNNKKSSGNKLQVLYLDNSYSMSVKKGARDLLDIAKEAIRKQVHRATPGTRFILLTNDKPFSFQPQPADKVLSEMGDVDVSAEGKSVTQVLATVQSLMQGENTGGADLYYYSDFQQSAFTSEPDKALMKNITFYGVPVQADEVQNVYIDTAYLTTPVLQTGESNHLVVISREVGKASKEPPVLQLRINGQVKSAASLNFTEKNKSTDTLNFQVNSADWQQIELSVNDVGVRYDDTFRIAARSAPALSVLELNEGSANPYIQAVFRAYPGFRVSQSEITAPPAEWKDYNLVILNGITRIDAELGKRLNNALQEGQSICMFPGKTNNFEAINEGLKQIGDIHITGLDTSAQTAASVQQGSALVKDLFEKIPDNVQLPLANWHYIIAAGLSANQQSVLSFRNGDAFLARYMPSRGALYMSAVSADLQAGNFPGSYFFAPFLYEMAMQSGSSSIYAITTGKQQPVYLSLNNAVERNTVHIFGKGLDVIPPQRSNGAGLDVFVDPAVKAPGFYQLAAPGSDTTRIALNEDRSESQLDYWDISTLKKQWKGDDINWVNITDSGSIKDAANGDNFPLWKVCIILALIMLAAETYLLARRMQKPTVAVAQ